MSKKIFIFSTAYFPFIGGAEVAVKAITDLLPDIQFDMITARMYWELPRFEKMGNINVYRVGIPLGNGNKILRRFGNFLYIVFGFWKAVFLHFKNRYDATWSIMAAYAGAIGLFFKIFHLSVPFLLTLQEGDEPEYIKKRVGWYRIYIWKLLFKISTRIQAISSFLADWARENGAICPIDVVPNGVDFDKLEIRPRPPSLRSGVAGGSTKFETIAKIKSELNIKPEDKIIITLSRLVEKNGVDNLINAMQFLPENYTLLVLGIGPLEKDLKFEITNLKLEKRVLMLGQISHDIINDYLAISNVFVRPSRSEGLGNVFLEAMAVGVPVIGTKVGGIPDFLFPPEELTPSPSLKREGNERGEFAPTGLFCEVNNPKSIAEKVLWLTDLKNEELKNKIIANAKKLVQEKYDWNLIAGKMEEIFEKLIERR